MNNIVFPKATNSWGEIIAFAVGAGKDSFGMKKNKGNSKKKWVEVKVGEPIITWNIPGFGTGEFKQLYCDSVGTEELHEDTR